MTRLNDPATRPFYDAAHGFVEAALQRDDSLFTPGQPIWTVAHLDDVYQRCYLHPDVSQASFFDKLRDQLAGADPAVYQLAGELLYVHLLIITGNMGGQAKRQLITAVLTCSPTPVTIPAERDRALNHGIARVGMAFLTGRSFQLGFLLEFVRHWKGLPAAEQTQALADPWVFKQILFSLPIQHAYAQREALLHLVHPDIFEGIVSRDRKQRLLREYAAYIGTPGDDVDRQLLQIREHYTRQHGTPPPWDPTGSPPAPQSPLPRSLGPHLRPYVQLVVHLDSSTYTPPQLVERLGRIVPSLAHMSSAPNPDGLVRDLLHLRLLTYTAEQGSYRRWPHLDDATEAHMLRYAALTLLVPTGTGDYDLPVLRAPFDGQPHPVTAWPYGADLLDWYVEAGLVQRHEDGTGQGMPDALAPLDATTPTARALATFLDHLQQAHVSQGDLPSLADDALPILDPTTLDERIAEIQRDLLIDRMTILRIYRALIAGQHVILSGPPGTGKTHLARLLPQVLWRDAEPTIRLTMPTDPLLPPTEPPIQQRLYRNGYAVEVVTATEDWGIRHVLGGIVPQLQRTGNERTLIYSVRHGCLTRAVLLNYRGYDGTSVPPRDNLSRQEITAEGQRYRGRWLVIDEFTRAPVDAAFGSLLTTLGGQRSPLMVPTDAGDVAVALPRDFRIIGTLNSFDRHFLNQISEAMKRRFTFIDVLPPGHELAAQERAMAVYRTLVRLQEQGMLDVTVDADRGEATWEEVLQITRTTTSSPAQTLVDYHLTSHDAAVEQALDDFWRIFRAIRCYRQLGTAQAEAVCSALFTGQSIGMDWAEALDSALADTLADQLQVLARDEQRVLLAYLEHAADADAFTRTIQHLLTLLPGPRQIAHLAQLRAADTQPARDPIDDLNPANLTHTQLSRLFDLGQPLLVPVHGLFARRLSTFINERGL